MRDAHASPAFPGPLGPPGEVESLLRLTLGRVNEADLRDIAAVDYGQDEARVLELLCMPRREGRWPTIADAGEAAFQLHECCSLVLTEAEGWLGGPHRWRLLFAAGLIAHLVYGPGRGGDTWTDLRIAQMLILAMELGPQAAAAVRPFIAWMRERPPQDEFYEPHEYDVPILLLDAATGGGLAVTDERVVDLYERVRTFDDSTPAPGARGPCLERALWSNWFDDPARLSRHVAQGVRAMSPTDPPPAMRELLASMLERREPDV